MEHAETNHLERSQTAARLDLSSECQYYRVAVLNLLAAIVICWNAAPALAAHGALLIAFAQSRHRVSQARARSATHRRGRTSKRWLLGLRFTAVSNHPPTTKVQVTS